MQEMNRLLRPQATGSMEDGRMAGEGFEAFYEAERDGLFGALVLITGNRNEAEEIAQDAFLALWERWERVAGLENPSGYLYRTAMNGFRRRRRRAALAVRKAFHLAPTEDLFAQADARQVVAQALAGVSRRQRAALVLTELLGFTSEEAAQALGIRPVTGRCLAPQGPAAVKRRMERS